MGTNKDNVDDRVSKGRSAKGSGHGKSILIEENIPIIWERLRLGDTGAQIARDYNVTRVAISSIKLGKTWEHITESLLLI